MIAAIHGILDSVSGYDPDAQAFITAAALSSSTHKTAINSLVVGLKDGGLWSKFKAIYPMVGGVEVSHKYNLKDPRNLDAAYRLGFVGFPTHNANGVSFNGTTQYASTFLNPSTALSRFNHHLSYYNRSAVTDTDSGGRGSIGVALTGTSEIMLSVNRGNKIMYVANSDAALVSNSYASPQVGLFMGVRSSDTSNAVWLNGVKVASNTITDTGTLPNSAITLGRGASTVYSVIPCSFASIGDSLTDSEALAFYNIVQQYQTTLGRQV